jgi:hypothetical protein
LQITGIFWNDGDQGVFQFLLAGMWIIHILASGHCEPHAGRFMWEVHYSGEAVSGDCFAAHQSWFLRLLRRLAKTGEKLMIFFSMLPVAE